MTDRASNTDGKIIIDAYGTEKNVFTPKASEPQVPVEAKPTLSEKIVDAAVPILAGTAAAEVVDLIQEKLHGKKDDKLDSEKSASYEKEKELDFSQIEDTLFGDKSLEADEKKKLEVLRQERIDEFNKLDGGRFAEELSISVRKTLRKFDWDDVYDEVGQVGRNFEKEMRNRAELPDRLNGIVLSAVRYESARVLKAGLDKQSKDIGPQNMRDWIKNKNKDQYSDEELKRLYHLAERSFIRLAPDAPEELVGRDIKKEEAVVPVVSEPATPVDNEALNRIAVAAERTAKATEKTATEIEHLEPENNNESGWSKLVLLNISRAETDSDIENKSSSDRNRIWLGIERSIESIPDKLGLKHNLLSQYYKDRFPDGVFLKEKLKLIFEARKRLNDRYIEIKMAGGSLAQMGQGSDDIKLKNITPSVQEIEPMDKWILIHSDEIVNRELMLDGRVTRQEQKELLPDLSAGLSAWLEMGINNYDEYKNALNSFLKMNEIRHSISVEAGSIKAEDLANRLFEVWLTKALFDRDRAGQSGKSEDRELFMFETARGYNYAAKEREPGVDYTIRRYWAKPDQEGLVRDISSKKMRYRRDLLHINSQRSVFIEDGPYNQGQVFSDYLHATTVPVEDELDPSKTINRKLISFVLNRDGTVNKDGWKKIPFYNLSKTSYSGYFGYPMGISKAITTEMSSTTWKKVEEIVPVDFWENKRQLFDRLTAVSPWFNSTEFSYRGRVIRELAEEAGVSTETIQKISGFSSMSDFEFVENDEDLDKLTEIVSGNGEDIKEEAEARSKVYTENQINKIRMIYALGVVWPGSLDATRGVGGVFASSAIDSKTISDITKAITVSRYLEGEYLRQFKYEIFKEMGFGPRLFSGVKKRYGASGESLIGKALTKVRQLLSRLSV